MTTENTKVIITEASSGFCVEVINGDDIDKVWGGDGGLLMDAITTAVITADETGASNAKAWHTYCDSVKSLVGDEIDAMERDLLATESYLDYCWAFSPEEVSK